MTSQGVPSLGASNKIGVGKTSYFLANFVNISKTVEDIVRSKLLLMTEKKSYMRFRLAPRSMTLDDLELL